MDKMTRSMIGMVIVLIIMLVASFGLDAVVAVYDYIFGEHSIFAIFGTIIIAIISLFAFVENWD